MHRGPNHENSQDGHSNVRTNSESGALKTTENPQPTKSALFKALGNTSNTPAFDDHKNDLVTVMTKYSAYWVSKGEGEKVYSVLVELPHLETVIEAIRDVLPYLNQSLAEENSPFILSEDPTHFDLYKAKKTGHPKLDYPALDSSQILNQTGVQMISIVEKDARAVIPKNGRPSLPVKETTMIHPPMPNGRMSTNSQATVDNDIYEEETVCLCIKRTKTIKKKDPLLTNQH